MAKRQQPIYRPVSTRVWNDRRFLSLSDHGRLLWLFLLTAPSIPIPGIVLGGEATLAEQLGWSVEALRKGFDEIENAGLHVRREARLVWLVNALEHQPPSSPNMLRQWAKFWDDVPESELKHDIWKSLKLAAKSWSKVFEQGFAEPFGRPTPSPSQALPQGLAPTNTNTITNTNTNTTEGEGAPSLGLPSAWVPEQTEELRAASALAHAKGVDVELAIAKFAAHARAHGWERSDWNAALVKWLLDEKPPTAAQRAAAAESDRAERDRKRREVERAAPRPSLAIVRELEPGDAAAAYQRVLDLAKAGTA